MDSCNNCGKSVPAEQERCPVCQMALPHTPNVREADKVEERQALEVRYQAARESSRNRGALAVLEQFEAAMADARATINIHEQMLRTLVEDQKALYANYHALVSAEVRLPADDNCDRRRKSVDGMFFGYYSEKICFAALSLNGRGLVSYGEYCLHLKNLAIENRTSLLENNSYHFVKKHGLCAVDDIPRGFRCSWPSRGKLAVAKLADAIGPDTKETEFPAILLHAGADKADDEFIEAHIYHPLCFEAVESVYGTGLPADPAAAAHREQLKTHIRNLGVSWVSHD